MAESEHLKDLKAVWGDSCHSMWVELLCISITESHLISNYREIPSQTPVAELFHVPELRSRISSLRKDDLLDRGETYRNFVVTNRLVILSAVFETYINSFLDAYIASRAKLFDEGAGKRTTIGDKLYGEVTKCRGLSNRIRRFAELTNSKINSIEAKFSYIDDVYTLRNILAHRAGLVDTFASSSLSHVSFRPGDRIIIAPDQLLALAAPIIKIAESLDKKILSTYDPSTGQHIAR